MASSSTQSTPPFIVKILDDNNAADISSYKVQSIPESVDFFFIEGIYLTDYSDTFIMQVKWRISERKIYTHKFLFVAVELQAFFKRSNSTFAFSVEVFIWIKRASLAKEKLAVLKAVFSDPEISLITSRLMDLITPSLNFKDRYEENWGGEIVEE